MNGADNRRRYTRHQIELAGQVELPSGRRCAVTVRDYCRGGMLLQWSAGGAEELAEGLDSAVKLHARLLTRAGSQPIAVPAKVAWVCDDHLGIAFHVASEGIVKALQTHHRLATGATNQPSNWSGEARCLAKLRHLAQGVLPGLQRDLLRRTSEGLHAAADKVASNSEQQQVFGDMNTLESLGTSEVLSEAVLSRAFDEPPDREAVSQPSSNELTLIDPNDFERWLEASRTATLLERDLGDQLTAIGSRLSALRGHHRDSPCAVPLEPEHFTAALNDIASRFELGETTRRLLFASAATVLSERLPILYREIEGLLDAFGAPSIQSLRCKSVRRAQPAEPSTAETEASQSESKAVADTHAAVSAGGSPGATQGAASSIGPATASGPLAEQAEQRESLARELLELVSNAPSMTESLAEWVQQLGEPLMQQAVSDQTFFQNRQHPLRVILDGLSHLQLFRAHPDESPEQDALHQHISALLEPVRRGEAESAELAAIAQSITELTNDQSRLYQRRVERVAEVSEGRDRVRRARQAIAVELNRRYAGKQVPEVFVELLDVGWRAVLELAWLNLNDDSRRYPTLLRLLDDLVRVLGGDAHDEDAALIDPPALLAAIQTELASTAFDPFRRAAVERRLESELLDPSTPSSKLVSLPAFKQGAEEDMPPAPPEGISPSAWQRCLERCAAIKVGDLLCLLNEPEGRRNLRVAWIRSDRAKFALVDHRGLKSRGLSHAELALGLYNRNIVLQSVDGQPISDRAVDAMLERMEERLAYQAAHDSLTGLINRRQFNAALEKALAVPNRPADSGVLLLFDIDQFRLVNDVHGYDTGDRLLVAIARLLEKARGAKVLGHLGGDRFAAILPDMGADDALAWANELCEAVRGMSFDWQGQALGLSVSVGVASFEAEEADTADLLRSSENAVAAAKHAGGDQVYLYRVDDPSIARRQESVQWVVQVDEALDQGRLHLRCQPIVPVRPEHGLTSHYEVLLGVCNGTDAQLPIAEFIEAAERYNRMRAVDRWVTKSVVDWIAAKRDHMPELHGFAVNLSGQTASDPGFVEFVRDQFQRTGIDPSWVSFEVTETAAIADLSNSAGIVRELKALGCKVALDDFGSGLASYSYLKELPVDWLKIDGVFVRKIAADQEDMAVVKSINEIGHFLGKQTIAEYVADAEILQRVKELGVDYAQGFFVSPPLLLDDLLQTPHQGILSQAQ